MAIFRNSQGYMAGLGSHLAAAGVNVTLTGTIQVPSLLQDMYISQTGGTFGLVDEITLSGQSLMCSNKGADIKMWSKNALIEGSRGIGCPIDQNQQVQVKMTLAAAANVSAAIGTDPLSRSQVIPINDLGDALSYVTGLGSQAVGAGASAIMNATILRSVTLGRLVLTFQDSGGAGVTSQEVFVTSIKVNAIELLSSGQEFSVELLSHDQSDNDGTVLAYRCPPNSTIEIGLRNSSGLGAITVYGGIYNLPSPALARAAQAIVAQKMTV